MKILAIDTSSDKITLALNVDGKNYYYSGNDVCKKHNSVLLEKIDRLLSDNNIKISEIDVFGVVVGPGSFTGIRIGVATANALAMSGNKKIVEITSLEQFDDGTNKLVLLDCKHDNYYVGKFVKGGKEYLALSKSEIEEIDLPKVYLIEPVPENILKKCLEKIANNDFSVRAKPFYLKQSSAERA